jgi:RNA polymerase sigma-70 factor (ECF subfamily)
MDSGDEAAIEKARQGDRDAFRLLVERHSRSVYRLAYRMTGTTNDAEDMVQETFLRAWKQIHRFDHRASFATWVHRICANCSLDHIRLRNRFQDLRGRAESEEEASDPFAQLPASAPSPERLAQSSQITAILVPAINELTEMERVAFIMRHYEGCSIDSIAEALNVQRGAAKHSVFRAVQKLRRALAPAMSSSR